MFMIDSILLHEQDLNTCQTHLLLKDAYPVRFYLRRV